MSYISPIEIVDRITSQLKEDVTKVILSYGIEVDKNELIKALSYDRKQYEKGFADGQRAGERIAKVTLLTPDSKGYWSTNGRCQGCGFLLERKHAYCPNCGARLEWN